MKRHLAALFGASVLLAGTTAVISASPASADTLTVTCDTGGYTPPVAGVEVGLFTGLSCTPPTGAGGPVVFLVDVLSVPYREHAKVTCDQAVGVNRNWQGRDCTLNG